ncbi:uncharacterized protein LOC6561136 [Drosophila grimshawi]|uniref:GH21289 n=1 Tax=Drosophila grimshawi TaxID=7222 RepID=B4J7X5_DROGR|nr:uncharacterized protein LOC6561136 [Drosophila grimshawi]EDW01181.1 GH21289 [Drosophila grimshawi]
MSKFFVIALIFAAAILYLADAAPASNLLDAKATIDAIIASYNQHYPGHSVVHPWEVASVIDVHTFHPNLHFN